MHYTMPGLVAMALAVVPVPPGPAFHEFYPVNVGDRWDYESSARGPFSNEVVSFDGSAYRVRSTDASGRVSHFDVELRGDSVLLRLDQQDSRLLVDFGLPLGGSFIGSAGAAAEIVTFTAEHESFAVSDRTFALVREYRHEGEGGLVYSSFYARGIGLVSMQWASGMSVHLVAADVAGARFEQ
jgi:hypothetical protein